VKTLAMKQSVESLPDTRLESECIGRVMLALEKVKPVKRDTILRACLVLNSAYLPIDYSPKSS
jgi:hypothetical protein